jgi:addiction module HigA family antidote
MSKKALPARLPLGLREDCPPHPGPLFRSQYRERWVPTLPREAVAARLSISPDALDRFEQGRESLTAELAVRLGEVTGTDPELWATIQMQHDLWHAIQSARRAGTADLGGHELKHHSVRNVRYVDYGRS